MAVPVSDAEALFRAAAVALEGMPPAIFFSVMAFGCVLPLPISPFYLVAGSLFGPQVALFWIAPALVLNQLVAHRLAQSHVGPWLEGRLARRGRSVPKPRTRGDQLLLTLLIRVTPGIPYAFQNWILGLAGIDRVLYLVLSWPIQMAYAVGWVVLGGAVFEGEIGAALTAVAVLVVLALLSRWGRRQMLATR